MFSFRPARSPAPPSGSASPTAASYAVAPLTNFECDIDDLRPSPRAQFAPTPMNRAAVAATATATAAAGTSRQPTPLTFQPRRVGAAFGSVTTIPPRAAQSPSPALAASRSLSPLNSYAAAATGDSASRRATLSLALDASPPGSRVASPHSPTVQLAGTPMHAHAQQPNAISSALRQASASATHSGGVGSSNEWRESGVFARSSHDTSASGGRTSSSAQPPKPPRVELVQFRPHRLGASFAEPVATPIRDADADSVQSVAQRPVISATASSLSGSLTSPPLRSPSVSIAGTPMHSHQQHASAHASSSSALPSAFSFPRSHPPNPTSPLPLSSSDSSEYLRRLELDSAVARPRPLVIASSDHTAAPVVKAGTASSLSPAAAVNAVTLSSPLMHRIRALELQINYESSAAHEASLVRMDPALKLVPHRSSFAASSLQSSSAPASKSLIGTPIETPFSFRPHRLQASFDPNVPSPRTGVRLGSPSAVHIDLFSSSSSLLSSSSRIPFTSSSSLSSPSSLPSSSSSSSSSSSAASAPIPAASYSSSSTQTLEEVAAEQPAADTRPPPPPTIYFRPAFSGMSASGTVAPPYPGDVGDDASNYALRASAAAAAAGDEEDEALTMAHLSALRDYDGDGLEGEGANYETGIDNSDESNGVNHLHQMPESAYHEHAFESDLLSRPFDSTAIGCVSHDSDLSGSNHHDYQFDSNADADADAERSPFETLLAALTRLPRAYHDDFMRLWARADTSSSEEDIYGNICTPTLPALLRAAAADARAQIQRGGETTRGQRIAREFVALAARLDDVCVALLHS